MIKPKLIAHRGHSLKYPENTIISFKKAITLSPDELTTNNIELAVQVVKKKNE